MRKGTLIIVITVICLLVVACETTTTGQQTTPLPPPTEIPTASPKPGITLPFFDDFSAIRYDWQLGYFPGAWGDVTHEIDEGVYHWVVTAHGNAFAMGYAGLPAATNFTASVDARQITDIVDDSDYGLVFSSIGGERYYYFAVGSGIYSAYFFDESTGWEVIVEWAQSEAILDAEFNNLKLISANGSLAFYANGTLLTEIPNDRLAEGRVGLGVDVYTADHTVNFEFDNFSMTSP